VVSKGSNLLCLTAFSCRWPYHCNVYQQNQKCYSASCTPQFYTNTANCSNRCSRGVAYAFAIENSCSITHPSTKPYWNMVYDAKSTAWWGVKCPFRTNEHELAANAPIGNATCIGGSYKNCREQKSGLWWRYGCRLIYFIFYSRFLRCRRWCLGSSKNLDQSGDYFFRYWVYKIENAELSIGQTRSEVLRVRINLCGRY
jgi:hypothetical protein